MMKNEKGRSMVEMLGVLAIIGVLSVAGIAGYTMAMNKYRANEIVNAASQVAIVAQSRYETNSDNSETTAVQAGYSSTEKIGGIDASNISADASAKTITITGVSADVGKNIRGILGTSCKIGEFTVTANGGEGSCGYSA